MLGALVLALGSLVEPTVEPTPKPAAYALQWEAPTGCPDLATIEARVGELLGARAGGEGGLHVEGRVEATPGGFALDLRTSFGGRDDLRRVESPDCDALGQATALVIATALEPERSRVAPAPSLVPPAPTRPIGPAAPPPPSDEIAPAPLPPSEPSARVRRRSPPRQAWLRLAPLFEWGSLPAVGGGTSLAFGLAWRRWRLAVEGLYLWPRRAEGPAHTAGLYQLGAAGPRGCVRLWSGRVEFPICTGLELGALRVDSRGITPERRIHAWWLAPTVGSGVAFAGERVGLWTQVEVGFRAVGARVLVGEDTAFRTRLISLRVVVGLEIFFSLAPSVQNR